MDRKNMIGRATVSFSRTFEHAVVSDLGEYLATHDGLPELVGWVRKH